MDISKRKSVLIIGGGAVGAIAALNLEVGGLAEVTLVLRSNYNVVSESGYNFESCDHGSVKAWKPSIVRNTIPSITHESLQPYDYILLSTKNIPDIPPSISTLVAPALPASNTHTILVLIQNGLNIEKPFLDSHPSTPVISGVSLIGSAEPAPGHIVHDEPDKLFIGAFTNPAIDTSVAQARAQEFVRMYAAGGKTTCVYSANVLHDRWKKLVYNACLNPICAITGLDTGRIRLADGAVEALVKPAMREIIAAARAAGGVELEEGLVQWALDVDPLESYLKPSMQQDLEKGNFIEFENLVGEPLREGRRAGVQMPVLEVLYGIAKAVQWRVKEEKGMVGVRRKV